LALIEDPIARELARYLTLVRLHYRTLLATTTAALLVAALYHFNTRPLYRANVQIVVESKAAELIAQSRFGDQRWYGMDYELEILQSLDLAFATAARLEREGVVERIPRESFVEKVEVRVLGRPASGVESEQRVVSPAQLRGRVRAAPIQQSAMASVWVTSQDPEFAAAAANALAATYIDDSRRSASLGRRRIADMLSGQLDNQRGSVGGEEPDPERRLEATDLRERAEVSRRELDSLTGALTAARTERLAKETTYRQAAALSDQERLTLPAVAGAPGVARAASRLQELEGNLAGLSETYGEKHPKMREAREATERARDVLEQETLRAVEFLKQDYLNALAREQQFEQSLVPVQQDLDEIRQLLAGEWSEEREDAVNRQLFDLLLQRSRQAEVESELDLNTRRVVASAAVPGSPSTPNLARNYRLALLLGLGLGTLIVIFREHLGDTVETPMEIKRLGFECLGAVPSISRELLSPRHSSRVSLLTNRVTQTAEAFRVVRTHLTLSKAFGAQRRVLVTSVSPGEGKSTITANLAATLAENGSSVLVVDADLRRPTLNEAFELPRAPGLSDLILGTVELAPASRSTQIAGLSLLPCGSEATNPAEILGTTGVREMLSRACSIYDWVLVDSPPVLAVADATILSPAVDGIVLVVESGRTPAAALREAEERLRSVAGRIVGVVLNKVDVRRSASVGGYYYEGYTNRYLATGRTAETEAAASSPEREPEQAS